MLIILFIRLISNKFTKVKFSQAVQNEKAVKIIYLFVSIKLVCYVLILILNTAASINKHTINVNKGRYQKSI